MSNGAAPPEVTTAPALIEVVALSNEAVDEAELRMHPNVEFANISE